MLEFATSCWRGAKSGNECSPPDDLKVNASVTDRIRADVSTIALEAADNPPKQARSLVDSCTGRRRRDCRPEAGQPILHDWDVSSHGPLERAEIICVIFDVDDSSLVSDILDVTWKLEKTFLVMLTRFLAEKCAIISGGAPRSQPRSVEMDGCAFLEYFLRQANRARFLCQGRRLVDWLMSNSDDDPGPRPRFVDWICSHGHHGPLSLVLAHGGEFDSRKPSHQELRRRLTAFINRGYGSEVRRRRIESCLRLLDYYDVSTAVPGKSDELSPMTLEKLCVKTIRKRLKEVWALPDGVHDLTLPPQVAALVAIPTSFRRN